MGGIGPLLPTRGSASPSACTPLGADPATVSLRLPPPDAGEIRTAASWVGRWRGTEVALFHRPPTKLYVPVSGHTAFQSFNPMLLVV